MHSSPYSPKTSYRFVIAILIGTVSFSSGLNMYASTPVFPLIMDEYDISRGTVSLLLSSVLFTHGLLGIPIGIFVGRINLKLSITIGLILASSISLVFLTTNFYTLLVLRTCWALGMGFLWPAMGRLIMEWFKGRELPIINSIFPIAFSLGIAVSASSIVPLYQMLGSWQNGLSFMGFTTIIGLILWVVLGKSNVEYRDLAIKPSFKDAIKIIKSKNTFLIALADAGPYCLLTISIGWFPTYYHETLGMSLDKAGFLMGILSFAGTLSLMIMSVLVIWVSRRRPLLIWPGIAAGIAGLGSIFLADTPLIFIVIAVLGFACWFYLPPLLTIPMELPESDSNSVAIIFAVLQSLGSLLTFIAPFIVGYTTDLLGSYIPSLVLFSAAGFSLVISGYLLPETGKPYTAE